MFQIQGPGQVTVKRDSLTNERLHFASSPAPHTGSGRAELHARAYKISKYIHYTATEQNAIMTTKLTAERGFSAWISVDDSPLPVYEVDTEMTQYNKEQISCYIPSEAGKVWRTLFSKGTFLTPLGYLLGL